MQVALDDLSADMHGLSSKLAEHGRRSRKVTRIDFKADGGLESLPPGGRTCVVAHPNPVPAATDRLYGAKDDGKRGIGLRREPCGAASRTCRQACVRSAFEAHAKKLDFWESPP